MVLDSGLEASAIVTGELIGLWNCTPAQVHFGMLSAPSDPVTRVVTIRSTKDVPFRILSAETPDNVRIAGVSQGGSGLSTTPLKSHQVQLVLEGNFKDAKAYHSGTIRLRTDLAQAHEIEIPWSAFSRVGQ